jgi:acyl carrier protein phosphodiesterase
MNFLAHAYLSGDNEKLLLGNFIADFVKGRSALALFEDDVKNGIYLHRAIDAFTDTHPVVSQSKDRLRPKYRHYAGVIVDMFYDHFLALDWHQWHEKPLNVFAKETYGIISSFHDILPDRVKAFFPYMVRGDWLTNYARVEGIGRALTGMSRRTPYESYMDESVNELVRFRNEFHEEFRQFFPELKRHAEAFINAGFADPSP